MNTLTRTSPTPMAAPAPSIHPATRMGHVHLTVADLDRQLTFYQNVLGFKLHRRDDGSARLGAGGEDLLRLTEVRGARRVRGRTGLYHVAVLFPGRRELARAIARLFSLRHLNHPTDHIMTKTTYLDDAEGNGLELYAESPEDGTFEIAGDAFAARRADGSPSDGREPLDVEALFAHLTPDDRLDQPIPADTKIGHVHLHVAAVDDAVRFYHGVIGFDLMGQSRAYQAAFVSAGGYHHHLGLNTWAGHGAPPPPPDSLGLRYFTVALPDQVEFDRVLERVRRAGIAVVETEEGLLARDPSQNNVLMTWVTKES